MNQYERDELVARALGGARTLEADGLSEASAMIRDLCAAVVTAHAANEVTKAHLREARKNEDNISGAAIMVTRELLRSHHVPPAAFIDDHVGNAIVQRNKLIACVREIGTMLSTGSSQTDIENHIAKALADARIDLKVFDDVEEEAGDDSEAP